VAGSFERYNMVEALVGWTYRALSGNANRGEDYAARIPHPKLGGYDAGMRLGVRGLGMEIERMILELRNELALLDEAIAHLERLADRNRDSRSQARTQTEESPQPKGNSAASSDS
jgi:hypothetical protein